MGAWVRTIAVFFFLGPLAAMFSEPFFEAIYDAVGWDTETYAGPLLERIKKLTGAVAFIPVSFLMIGAGIGVWVHFLAMRFERGKRAKRKPSTISLYQEIRRLQYALNEFERNPQGSYRKVRVSDPSLDADTDAELRSFLASIEAMKIPAPKAGDRIQIKDAALFSGYMAALKPFLLKGQIKEAKEEARRYLDRSDSNVGRPNSG